MASPTGAFSETITYLGGDDSATSVWAKVDISRYLSFYAVLLPGKGEQVANYWIVVGLVAWEYGLQGDPRADHPYKVRRPLALTFGLAGQMGNAGAYDADARADHREQRRLRRDR